MDMNTVIRKLRRILPVSVNKTTSSDKITKLVVEALESRLLLSADSGVSLIDGYEGTAGLDSIQPLCSSDIYTSENFIDEPQEFLDSEYKWPQPGGLGTPVTITYSYSNLLDEGFNTTLTSEKIRLSIEEALGLWAQYVPLHFVEVADSGPLPTSSHTYYAAENHPDMRFGYHDFEADDSTSTDVLPMHFILQGLASVVTYTLIIQILGQ